MSEGSTRYHMISMYYNIVYIIRILILYDYDVYIFLNIRRYNNNIYASYVRVNYYNL